MSEKSVVYQKEGNKRFKNATRVIIFTGVIIFTVTSSFIICFYLLKK